MKTIVKTLVKVILGVNFLLAFSSCGNSGMEKCRTQEEAVYQCKAEEIAKYNYYFDYIDAYCQGLYPVKGCY